VRRVLVTGIATKESILLSIPRALTMLR